MGEDLLGSWTYWDVVVHVCHLKEMELLQEEWVPLPVQFHLLPYPQPHHIVLLLDED